MLTCARDVQASAPSSAGLGSPHRAADADSESGAIEAGCPCCAPAFADIEVRAHLARGAP